MKQARHKIAHYMLLFLLNSKRGKTHFSPRWTQPLFHFNSVWIWEWTWKAFYSFNHYFLNTHSLLGTGGCSGAKQTWFLPSLRQPRTSLKKRQIFQQMNISTSYITHLQITEAWKYPNRWSGKWLMLGKAQPKRMRKAFVLLLAPYLAQSCCLLWV